MAIDPDETTIDIRDGHSGYELRRLSRCGPVKGTPWRPDPATTGHLELITMADRLATAVLNHDSDAKAIAKGYRALRIQAAVQAGQP